MSLCGRDFSVDRQCWHHRISHRQPDKTLLEMNVKSAVQSHTQMLITMLFYSETPEQCTEQQCSFVNCDAMFFVHF